MRNGRPDDGHVTAELLSKLIADGEAVADADPAGPAGAADLSADPAADGSCSSGRPPSDAALRDLAAVLDIAATTATSSPQDLAAREAAALASFREAHALSRSPGQAPSPSRAGRRTAPHTAPSASARLAGFTRLARFARRSGHPPGRPSGGFRRTRTALLSGLAAVLLGGGVAVAGAGGDLPFAGEGTERTGESATPATGATGVPESSAAPQAGSPASPTAPPTAPASDGGDSAAPSADAALPGEEHTAEEPAADADDRTMRSLCTAHARNPHLAPLPLVTAAGGETHIPAYCERLLSGPSPDRAASPSTGPGTPPDRGAASPGPPPPGERPARPR